MVYKTKGVCSQLINVEVENNIVTSVEFVGGCNGNTQGVAAGRHSLRSPPDFLP